MERTIKKGASSTVFKLYEIDLMQNDCFKEIEELRVEIPDTPDGEMALQLFFLKKETAKRYRDPAAEPSRVVDIVKHLKSQVVAIKYVSVLANNDLTAVPDHGNIDTTIVLKCLGDFDHVLGKFEVKARDYFNASIIDEEDFEELKEEEDDQDEVKEKSVDIQNALNKFMLGKFADKKLGKEGILCFFKPAKGEQWNSFIEIKLSPNRLSRTLVRSSTVSLEPEQVNRFGLVLSENCFHHKWDDLRSSFYFQRCVPIQMKCLMLLDVILNKMITVDEKTTFTFEEAEGNSENSQELSSDGYADDFVTVTARQLPNYGTFCSRSLPLHTIAYMPHYEHFKKEFVDDKPLSVNLACYVAQTSQNEREKNK